MKPPTDPALDRYSRQIRFHGFREEGQRRLLDARVTLCGCGALGTVLANALVRAGVGHLRLIDRDFIETSNLQRQVLFDEHDVAENLPKAEAAARKLGAINSSVFVEPIVADIDRTNILSYCEDVDLILDGTDNFEIRYLINDVAVKLGKPWIYGGCIGSHGQTMTIIPGETPCLRCVFEAAPAPGEAGTCETAGVLGPIVNIIASYQATEAFKILTGNLQCINRELLYFDIWDNVQRRIKIAPLLGKVDCPVLPTKTLRMAGRCARAHRRRASAAATPCRSRTTWPPRSISRRWRRTLRALGHVSFNRFLLKFNVDSYEFTVFPDGRAIIKGTSDEDKARTLYAKYIGH